MKKIKPIEDWIVWRYMVKCQRFILIVTSIIIVLTITAGVLMRYILKTDLFGIEEIMTLIAMWLYWVGGSYGSYEDSHIKADLCASLIKTERGFKILNIIIHAITVGVLCVLTKWGVEFAIWNIKSGGKTPGWGIPTIASQIPITISFIMMLFYSIYHLIRTIIPRVDTKGDEA